MLTTGIRSGTLRTSFLLLVALAATAPGQQLAPRALRGANYLPATARARDNATALLPFDNPNGLRGEFSARQVEDELALLASYGINNIRVLPAFYAFVVDKQAYMRSLGELARICVRHGLTITYMCWNPIALSAPPYPGGPLELWEELGGSMAMDPTNPLIYQSLLARSREMNRLNGHLVPPWEPLFISLHAEPGNGLFQVYGGDYTTWPFELQARIDEYLDALATFFSQDPAGRAAFASYDLFNEPNALGSSLQSDYLLFLQTTYRRLHAIHPGAHFTVGWAAADDLVDHFDHLLRTSWGVPSTYISGHFYGRPELFEELAAARARHAAGLGLDFVMSEFHRMDASAGVLEYGLSALVRHGLGGQVWGVLQSNAWLASPGGPAPLDGLVIPLDPGDPRTPIQFIVQNARDVNALQRWCRGQLTPREFTRIEVRDGAAQVVSSLIAGSTYTLSVESTLPGQPVLLALALEPFALHPCDRQPGPFCARIRALGPLFFSPATIAFPAGIIGPQGHLQPPLLLPLPAALQGLHLGASALVGIYPFAVPETNAAELTALHAWDVR